MERLRRAEGMLFWGDYDAHLLAIPCELDFGRLSRREKKRGVNDILAR